MILKNTYIIGCHIMFYEIEMIEEYFKSVRLALEEVENPETGNKIKVKTAMQLPDSHPAHKEAEKLIGGEKAKPCSKV